MKNRRDIINKALDRLNAFLADYGLQGVRRLECADGELPKIELNGDVHFSVLDVTAMPVAKICEECSVRGKEKILAIAPFFSLATADMLRADHINYADTAGNLLLRVHGNVFCVKNCLRPPELTRRITPGRCWNPQGLKVLFLFLTENEAMNWTYREIAVGCGVSLGTVNNVMQEALECGHLMKCGKELRWGNKSRIIDLWTANYALQLLPRLDITRYTGEAVVTAGECRLIAGGETAAAEVGLAGTSFGEYWSQGNIAPFIAKARWRLAENGNIIVKKAFWPEGRCFQSHVPWLLVYADLMAKDDSRCLEIAAEIRCKYLEGKQ